MPKYTVNPTEATAGQVILEKGEYAFEITKVAPFIFDKNPEKISYGVGATVKVTTDGPFKGKTIQARCFQHSDGARDMSKRFVMAALGFDVKQEDLFNAEFGGSDWSFDTDDKSVGDAWRQLEGKILRGDAQEVKMDNQGNQNQNINWKLYSPA